ncbi:MAG TPA: rhomboid family intramembrane serine protease [Acidimicrobiales bacterium]
MALPLRDDAPTKRTPWVTYGLILANVIVFLFIQPPAFQTSHRGVETYQEAQEVHAADRFTYSWGTVSCEITSGKPLADHPSECHGGAPSRDLDPDKNVWAALLTSLFIHGSWDHIAGNMLFLWVFGNNVEDRLGPLAFLLFYLVGGVVAGLGYVAAHPHSIEPAIGASGAIAAVMGAYLVFRPRGRILTVVASAAFQVVYVPAFVVLGLFFVTQFLTPNSDHVAWQAHVAGMAFGAIVALGLARIFPDPFRDKPAAPAAPTPPTAAIPDTF